MIRQPIIHELGTRFSIVTSIQQAEITPELGWVILDITGELPELTSGIEWLKKIGVKIEFIEKEE
jgi:hypothetical protein